MCTHPDSDLRLLLREYIRVVNVTAVVLRVAAGRLKNSCPKWQEDGYTCANYEPINRSTLDEDMRNKRFFTLSFPVTLNFDL